MGRPPKTAPPPPETPSKTRRKREAEALQELGEELLALRRDSLTRLPLPEELREAIAQAKRMHQRGALRRQRQFIGKLMRKIDAAPIREALEKLRAPDLRQTRLLHAAEAWRDRLLREGDRTIGELLAEFPAADTQRVRQLLRQAQRERQRGAAPRAARELFRYLRALFEPADPAANHEPKSVE